MKDKVLILGAGMVVKPMVDFLLENDIHVTLASRTLSKAEAAIKDHPNGKAVRWITDDLSALEEMISRHDVIVSLLPYAHHVAVARICIAHRKDMVTTSYVSEEMKALHAATVDAGIMILNEIGVDPGFDHMTAMRIIDQVHERGGSIEEFYSLCGALVAPEALDNPFNYKFSWSPGGVIMAGNNDATYLKDGQQKHINTEELFKDPMQIDFPGAGSLEVYPNRNSLPYIDLYGIPEAKTVYRGTFRYKNWCETFHILKSLGFTSYEEYDLSGKSYAQFAAELAGVPDHGDLNAAIADKLGISKDAVSLQAMDWLGLFSSKKISKESGSPFDVLSDLMIERMMIDAHDRDMVIMQHSFKVRWSDGSSEQVRCRFIDFGDEKYTSIAKTVAWPAAIAVKLMLDGKLKTVGVQIPTDKKIYAPVLKQLEGLGIVMEEEFGLSS